MRLKSSRDEKKPSPDNREKHLLTRVSAREEKKLKALAKLFTKGNVSEWMRYTSLNFKPKKGDFE